MSIFYNTPKNLNPSLRSSWTWPRSLILKPHFAPELSETRDEYKVGCPVSMFCLVLFLVTAGMLHAQGPNDLAPYFVSHGGGPEVTIGIFEGNGTVSDLDAIDPQGEPITYSIIGGVDASDFTINPATGLLTFLVVPDWENPHDSNLDSVYHVTVSASDGILSDTMAITVNVGNRLDGPSITTPLPGEIEEGQTHLLFLGATDQDGDPVTYSIKPTGDHAKFSFIPATRELRFAQEPNYETFDDLNGDNRYDLTIIVNDGQASAEVSKLIDVKNLAPSITSGGGGDLASVSVVEGNTTAYQTAVSDPAGGPVGNFQIIGGVDAGLFTINPVNGLLTFIQPPQHSSPGDSNQDNVYEVTIHCSDLPESGPGRTDSQALRITVTESFNPSDNEDGDRLTALMEKAFASDDRSGLPVVLGTGGVIVSSKVGLNVVKKQNMAGVDVSYLRPTSGLAGLVYVLQESDNGIVWQDSSRRPLEIDNGDGTTTALWTSYGPSGSSGFVRLRLEWNLSNPPVVQYTWAEGWQSTPVTGRFQTLSHSLIGKPVYSGTIGSVTSSTVTVIDAETRNVSELLNHSDAFYLEVCNGPNAGHRFEVLSSASGNRTFSLNMTSALNTAAALPSGLVGSRILVRRHVYFTDLAPKEAFAGATTVSGADQIQVFQPGGFSTYYLLDARNVSDQYYYWSRPGGIVNYDDSVVPSGTGVMIRHASAEPGNVSQVLHAGEVRGHAFRLILPPGVSLMAGGYPVDDSPNSRALTLASGLHGSVTASNADQIQVWLGDGASNLAGYTIYWLLDGGTPAFQFWTLQSPLGSVNDQKLLLKNRSQFYKRSSGSEPITILVQSPSLSWGS